MKKLNKMHRQLVNYFLVILGSFILAFGTVIFLTEPEIVACGVSGIAIIIQHFVEVQIYDYLVAGILIICWLVGLIFIGKDFAMKTLLGTCLYIGFTFLFKRVPFFIELSREFAGKNADGGPQIGNLILCAIFGGVFAGGGVAITFLGNGSTGGIDVIQVLLRKKLGIKESLSSIVMDALIVVVGMIAMRMWNPALCGILCVVISSTMIDVVYVKSQYAMQADIISVKWQLISWYVQEELGRGATIIKAEGGYQGEERTILRVVFDRSQYDDLKQFIAKTDPNAFVTFTNTNAVFGQGFDNHKNPKISDLQKEAKKLKKEKK